jgi:hypothetical protein
MTSDRQHHRPSMPGSQAFEAIEGDTDPASLSEAADRAAHALVRGARSQADEALVRRVVHLADSEGLETLAELWSGAAADSLAGSLWRLYLLRSWVYADPLTAAAEFDRGRSHVPVAEVISGVVDPPGPDEVRALVDEVLGGVVVGDFADTLFRAAAFARVAAAGRVHDEPLVVAEPGSSYAADVSASRLLSLADQLQHAARLELAGSLA